MHSPHDQTALFTFDLEYMMELAEQNHQIYQSNDPFPHIVIDDFLPMNVAERVLREFPGTNEAPFLDRTSQHQPGKFGTVNGAQIAKASPFLQHLLAMMNSYVILNFLTGLTGIQKLFPDPNFSGGGLHQIIAGGKLDIHADFNLDPRSGLYRRINLLIYLNKDWKPENGGYLELWNKTLTERHQNIAPIFNRCVIFNTDRHSYHGHTVPIAGPAEITRKSLALYYYTLAPAPGDEAQHSTLWQDPSLNNKPRPTG